MANQIRYQVGFDIQQGNLNQLKSSLQELQKMKISDIMKINNTDSASAITALNQIKEEAGKVEDALKQAFNTKLGTVNIESFNEALMKSETSIWQVYNTFQKAGTAGQNAFRSLSSQILSTNLQLKESHGWLDKMATTLANTVKWNAASAVVNGLSRSVQQAWGYVQSLDSSLNDIRIVTGKSADEMANFAVQANNAAKELGKTTTDYTNAALIYAQQGLSDKEIEQRAKITLKAANVTGQSTADVSEELTAVWNGYKVTADEAQLYVDRLAAVAATTASDLEELSTGMSKVAAAANAMGVGQDQLAAQLSTIIAATRQAPESVGTALRTVYARISDIKAGIDEDGVTLGNYSGKMAELGFNVLDVNGKLRDMGEVMEEIGGRWNDLTREQQVSLAQTMAGQRQYSNLIALFDNFEKYNEALNTARNAAGTLQEQQDIYMESTAAHLKQLTASIEDIYDSLADNDGINKIIDGLSSAANFVANFVDGLGGGAAVLRSLGAIGLTVFSEQIAKGLNTTITNFEIGKQNARQFDEALQATQDWQGIPGLDETSKSLLENREQMLELSKMMSPQQFQGSQTLLNDIIELGNQIQSLKEKKKPLEDLIKDFTDLSLTELLGNGEQSDKILNIIDSSTESLNKMKQKTKQVEQAFRDAYNESQVLYKNSNVNTFDQTFNKVEASVNSLMDSLHDFKQTNIFENMSTPAKQAIESIQNEWEDLIKNINTQTPQGAEQAKQAFQDFFNNLKDIVSSSSKEIQDKYKNLFEVLNDPTPILELEEKQNRFSRLFESFKNSMDKFSRAVNIENFTKLAGNIGRVGASIRQVQNLGSIWKNENISDGDKILQTVTNLAFSLPMLAKGIQGIVTTLGIAGSALNIVTGVATAAVVAYNLFTGARQANIEASIQESQKTIENENKKQAQIETNRQLYNSLSDLNEQYQTGQITRGELKTSVQELIEQYGLEGEEVVNLTTKYGDLKNAIIEAGKTRAEQGLASAKEELTNAENIVSKTISEENEIPKTLKGFEFTVDQGWDETDEAIVDEIMKKHGFQDFYENQGIDSGFRGLRLDQNYTIDDFLELYDTINATVQQINELDDQILSVSDRNKSEYYNQMVDFLGKFSEIVEQYRQAQADVKFYQEDLAGYTAEVSGAVSFAAEDVQNAADYIKQREALINYYRNSEEMQGKSEEQLSAAADAFIQLNHKKLYNQYNELVDFSKQVEQLFDKQIAGYATDLASKLDSQHFDKLMEQIDIHPSILTNWRTLLEVIKTISGQDLSNLQATAGVAQSFDAAGARATASESYNVYQSLQDQVASGKTISASQFKTLDPEIQSFFSMMANGSYKMTQDAKTFYNTINNLKLQGFYDTINQINLELERNQLFAGKNFDYNFLTTPKDTPHQQELDSLAQQQIDYLRASTDGDQVFGAAIEQWEKIIEQQGASFALTKDLAEEILKIGENTALSSEQVANMKNMLTEIEHQIHDALFPTDADVDTKALESLSEVIQQIADESDELADSLTQDARTSEDVAEAILRFDDAIQDVIDNYDDWLAALNSDSIEEQALVIDELRDAYADLLDLDGSSLSKDFLTNTDNLELMKAAIDGDTEAYEQLLDLAGEDIIAHLSLDKAQFENDLNVVQNSLDAMNFQDLQIGANLDTGNFLAQCENLVNNAGMTAQQATDYLASMGVDAEVIENKTQGTETKQQTGYETRLIPVTETGSFPVLQGIGFQTSVENVPLPFVSYSSQHIPVTTTTTDTKENSAFSLKVTSAHKSSGGGFKFSQAANGGGSKGAARRAPSTSKGGGGGRKGGSGGRNKGRSSSAQPDTSKKDPKKSLKDQRDIYHDINIQLEQINRQLERVQKQQDRLYGKELLDNLNKQQSILEKNKQTLQEKHDLQEQDLKQQQQTLKNLGVTFDQYGNIANYMDVLGNKQAEINNLIQKQNTLIEAYNKTTNKDAKKGIADQISALDKKTKNAEDEYKDLQDKIKNYDDLRNDMEDVVDQIEEELQKQIELQIEKFKMEIQIRLDMGQAERDWNEFRRNVLQKYDPMKSSNFDKLFGDAAKDLSDIYSYFDVRGSKGTIEALTDQLMNTRAEIEAIDKVGKSAIYGDNKAQAMEDLQNNLNELMDQMQDIEDLIDNIDEAYLDTIEDISKQFDEQIEDYQYIGELIEHDMDLLTLLYGDRNYDAMDRYFTTLQNNNLKQLDSLKQQREFWKNQWEDAVARGDTNAAKAFEENYKNTIKNLNDTIQTAAKNLQDKYINAIDKIFDELDKKISNGKGTDYLSTEWDLMNKNADEYLDTINSAFAIQQTERKYQNALNDTKNIKNQQALKQLMDEQLGILRNKEKITQYDIDRAEKLLQVEQARIALEDAQSAKTSLRLKRDSQGNYSYEYMADGNAVDEAQSNLASAQNDLYNFDKDRYQSNLNDILSVWRDFQSEYKDIVTDTSLSEEQRIDRLALLREEYGEYINNKTEENLHIRGNLMESAFADIAALYDTDVANYNQMSLDEQNILMGDLVPAWKSGIQQMTDKVAGEGGFIPICEEAFDNLHEATLDYENALDEMAETAGVDLNEMRDGVDEVAYALQDLIIDNDDLILRMQDEMFAISELRAVAQGLAQDYKIVYEQAKLAVSGIHAFLQAQQSLSAWQVAQQQKQIAAAQAAARAASRANAYSMSTDDVNYGSYTGSGPSGSGSSGGGASGSGGSGGSSNGTSANLNKIKKKMGSGGGGGTSYIARLDTGGYTGEWGNEGKLAILDEKELVLNEKDTENILNSIGLLNSFMSSINGTIFNKMSGLRNVSGLPSTFNEDGLEQKVEISANFPNVNSKREIEEAFNDLVNLAAQRAMRR